MNEFDRELENAATGISSGYMGIESFKNKIKQAIAKHVIGEDEDESPVKYHDYSLVSKDNLRVTNAICGNNLRSQQRQTLNLK